MTHAARVMPAAAPDPHAVLVETGRWISRTAWRLQARMPWADVEDMIQQGIMTALEQRERYRPELGVPFATFIKPRVMGAMIDLCRQTGSIRRREYRYVTENDDTDADDALDVIIRCEDIEILAGAIDALPGEERTAISLFYLEELRNKDVAEIMGISEVKVVRLRRSAIGRLARAVRVPAAEADGRLSATEGSHK